MFDDFTTPSSDSDDSELTTLDKMGMTAILLSSAHGLADFVLSSDEMLTAFCKFVGTDNDEEAALVRERMNIVHDSFAMLSTQAKLQLSMVQLTQFLGGDDAGAGFDII